MQKLKNGFRIFFLIATIISLLLLSCKQPPEEMKTDDVPHLTELKIDSAIKTISASINVGQTKKDKVLVEVKFSPINANIVYEPSLESGFWKLSLGQNKLKITLKKGSETKEYNVRIERIE